MSLLKLTVSCLMLAASRVLGQTVHVGYGYPAGTEGASEPTVYYFPWPGPVVVPLDAFIVTPPDSAVIQIANQSDTQRELRIRENIDAALDCSLILNDFKADNSLTESEITVRWYVRKFRSDQTLDDFETEVVETVNHDPIDPSYQFNGTANEVLIVGRSSLPQIAREGNAGDYRCEVCHVNGTVNCTNGVTSLAVIAYEPVILRGSDSYAPDSYYVGTDICVLPNDPREFVLTCIHNTSLPTTTSLPMRATWTQNSQPYNPLNAYTESTSLVIDAHLIVETFRQGYFRSILGVYECVLQNSGGNDTARSIVTKCCEDADILVINNSSGFVQVPPNDELMIGQSTCLSGAEGFTTITCPLESGPGFYNVMYTWLKDGQIIEGERNISIAVAEQGLYSCHVSNECGQDQRTSQIFILPNIITFTGSITGVTGDGCDRVGSPTRASDLCPKPNEQFTLSCDSNYPYVITGPGANTVSDGPLVIDSASSSIVGTYSCLSSNPCDSVSQSFTVELGQESGEWMTSSWSECSASSGCDRGVRTREVMCVGSVSRSPISDSLCEGEKPLSSEGCSGQGPCQDPAANWNVGDWSKCSKYCGMGTRTRSVQCQLESSQETVDDDQCDEPRPQNTSYCNVSPCCEQDLFPTQCNFVAGSNMCGDPMYQDICCCTCHNTMSYID